MLHKLYVLCLFSSNKRESTKIYNSLLEILELSNTYERKMALLAHKIKNDIRSIPTAFSSTLTPVTEIHNHNTRYASNRNFYRITTSTRHGQSKFQFSTSKIWELVPLHLKNLS